MRYVESGALACIVLVSALAGCMAPVAVLPRALQAREEAAPASPMATDGTVLLVHGFDPFGAVEGRIWAPAAGLLRERGWAQSVKVGYYACDSNMDVDISAFGPPGANQGEPDHQEGVCGERGHSAGTSLEHLALHLAWFVHDAYTTKGTCVDVLAHSQGGLIVRYAWEAVDHEAPGFPSSMCLDDVVTLGTPFEGLGIAECPQSWLVVECREMLPGSPFLRTFSNEARSTLAPRWTLIASGADPIAPSASTEPHADDLRVLYDAEAGIDHAFLLEEPGRWDERFEATVDSGASRWTGSIAAPMVVAEGALRHEFAPMVP